MITSQFSIIPDGFLDRQIIKIVLVKTKWFIAVYHFFYLSTNNIPQIAVEIKFTDYNL